MFRVCAEVLIPSRKILANAHGSFGPRTQPDLRNSKPNLVAFVCFLLWDLFVAFASPPGCENRGFLNNEKRPKENVWKLFCAGLFSA